MKYCEPTLNKSQWICKQCKNTMKSVIEKKECKSEEDFINFFNNMIK